MYYKQNIESRENFQKKYSYLTIAKHVLCLVSLFSDATLQTVCITHKIYLENTSISITFSLWAWQWKWFFPLNIHITIKEHHAEWNVEFFLTLLINPLMTNSEVHVPWYTWWKIPYGYKIISLTFNYHGKT